MPARDRLTDSLRRLNEKSLRHRIVASLVLLACYFAGPTVDDLAGIRGAEYSLFQALAGAVNRDEVPGNVILVLIGDDTYWLGAPAGRVPLNKTYIASLLALLEGSRAAVIGLDVGMRSPDPRKPYVAEIYRNETILLLQEVVRLAERHKVVLVKSIWESDSGYMVEPDTYQAFGICVSLKPDGTWVNSGSAAVPISAQAAANISCGYTALPYDERLVPGSLRLISGVKLQSFPLAI